MLKLINYLLPCRIPVSASSTGCLGWGQQKWWKLSKEWGGKDLGLFSVFITGSVTHPLSHSAPPPSSSCPSQQPLLLAQTGDQSRGLKMKNSDRALCPSHPIDIWICAAVFHYLTHGCYPFAFLVRWWSKSPNIFLLTSPSSDYSFLCILLLPNLEVLKKK